MSFAKSNWLSGGDDESDEDEVVDEQVRDRPDAICYLIDISTSMLETIVDEDDESRSHSNVSTALRSAYDWMKTRIISGSPRDVIGIVLYNTAKARNVKGEMPKNGLCVLVEPSTIRAANIKALSEVIEEAETDPETFKANYAPIDTEYKDNQLTEGMNFSDNLLRNRSSNLSNKLLYIITDDEDPFKGNTHQQKVANRRALDAHESGLTVKTFFMPADSNKFDLTKFWNRFRYDPSLDADMDNTSMIFSGEGRFERLLTLSSDSGKTKRAMFTIPFFLYEGIAMSITGYAAIAEQKKKAPVQVEQTDQIREIYFKTQFTDESTGEDLNPKRDIVKYMRVGEKGPDEQRIFFDDGEVLRMKNLGMSPSLKLLGFQPRNQIKPYHSTKHSYLIYPNETQYANSIPAFSALLKSMLKKGLVGLGILIARSNSSPQFVYMIPQAEVRDEETDNQQDPPCIWLVQIPFADDIRPPIIDTSLSVVDPDAGESNTMIDAFRKVIHKMKIQYTPYQYANPALSYHYANLEAIALSQEQPDPTDETIPETDTITSRIAPFVEKLKTELEDNPKLSAFSRSGAGDAQANDEDAPPHKKVRTSKEKASQDIGKLEKALVTAIKKDSYKGITNDFIKDYLKQKDVSGFSTKRKPELIQMATEQLKKDRLL